MFKTINQTIFSVFQLMLKNRIHDAQRWSLLCFIIKCLYITSSHLLVNDKCLLLEATVWEMSDWKHFYSITESGLRWPELCNSDFSSKNNKEPQACIRRRGAKFGHQIERGDTWTAAWSETCFLLLIRWCVLVWLVLDQLCDRESYKIFNVLVNADFLFLAVGHTFDRLTCRSESRRIWLVFDRGGSLKFSSHFNSTRV